ncbi:hypothetical protein BB934_40960 (plasmid) [Microvirga ossetica]|uniref:CobQ/CobB/MinD/ParA nucleotide binding domain-containing protein n=1 Tax=Microvirga ossetica TaxID=1882682 RepID=A0A1B2EX47_9HYPH|nr:hypothetical protein [Microvirga ossetica]ANY84560.1 hypothetical protein BB934_40960 [Microvirga ossetica]
MAKNAKQSDAAKRAVVVANEKGGVGKTVAARALIDHLRSDEVLRSNGVRVAAYDADGGVGGLVRVLGTRGSDGRLIKEQDPIEGIGYYNVRADNERNMLLDAVASGEPLIVHDLAGGSLADLMRIVDGGEGLDGLVSAFVQHGYRLTVVHVISSEIGASQSVGSWIDLVGDQADHVAVRNTRWGKAASDFPFWHGFVDSNNVSKGGKTRERLLELGGVEIDLPALPAGTFAKVDASNLPFSKAINDASLTITEKAHVQKFIKDFANALAPARSLLGF